MNIINGNKVHVVIGVIKDEKILDYPLGESDYNIEGENLETRIDIYYMNTRFKNLDKHVMQSIYTKYSKIYKSITFLSNPIQNFDNLLKKNKEMELKIIKMEKEKKEYEDKIEKEKKEYEEMKRKEYEDMKLKIEKEKKEYEEMKRKEYEDMKLKMEKEKKEYEDMKLKMENERKDKDAKTEESENQPEHGKNYKVIEEKNGDN